MLREWNLGFVCLAIFFQSAAARAFSLSPMSVSFEPVGKEATHSFVVDNNGNEKLAIQITMAGRVIDATGAEKNPDADDEFVVYPSQLVLKPNEKRTVRVTWAGNVKPERELSYRIIAEQLPVDTAKPDNKNKIMIRMLLRYLGAVYITPKGATAKVVLSKAARVVEKSLPKLALSIENTGTAHQIIKNAKLKITLPGKAPVELNSDDLKPLLGQNILAGGVRRFLFPWPGKLGSDTLGASESELKAELETNE